MPDHITSSIDDRVALIRIDRPEARNVLSLEVMSELSSQLAKLNEDEQIGCIVIAGSDEVFASGADIAALAERRFDEAMFHPSAEFWTRLASCRKPLIAAVSGWVLGRGCELALACDMIVASETTQFGQPEIGLGIIPGGGGTQALARVLGKQRTMELILTGRRIDAREAERLGIVNVVTEPDRWLECARDLVHRVASQPPLAATLAKQAVLAAEDMPVSAARAHERRLYELAMGTEDRIEGMTAFLEKRPPRFTGR